MSEQMLKDVLAQHGVDFDPVSVRLLKSRCGLSATLDCGGEKALLKFVRIDPADPDTRNRHRGLIREATVLGLLAEEGDRRVLADHADPDTAWTLQRWIEGDNAWEATAEIRRSPADPVARQRFLSTVVDMIDGLRRLHGIGYLHGDLQASHFILSPTDGCRLVDFDVAVEAGTNDYGGGLVHFVSPEVARGMASDRTDIALDTTAEIYSLASVVFFLYSGRVSSWYGDDPGRDDFRSTDRTTKCLAIADGRRRTFEIAGTARYPALEAVLNRCLALEPAERPADLSAVRDQFMALAGDLTAELRTTPEAAGEPGSA